jgi:DNA modification methylase
MSVRVLPGDCRAILSTLPAASVHCVVTSPPYWGLRDYGCEGQLGLEPTPEAYVAAMVGVFREVRRVLRADGTLWLNMGDGYNANQGAGFDTNGDGGARKAAAASPKLPRPPGLKAKDLIGQPWRLAFALQADGWYLRADIIWAKPNPMPESVTDRPTKAHEYVFLLTKSARYFYDADAVREPSDPQSPFWRTHPHGQPAIHRTSRLDGTNEAAPNTWLRTLSPTQGRNLRSVWTLATEPTPEAHFATFPTALASRCIQAGSSERGCCAACGAPWERQTSVSYTNAGNGNNNMARQGADFAGTGSARPYEGRKRKTTETIGWQPSCACEAPTVPCTVLDPFGGSGTVGAVAERLGRHSILIELSSAYVRIAEARTAQRGLFTHAPQAVAE